MVALRIRTPQELARALDALERGVREDIVRQTRKTARWGRSRVLKTSRNSDPRPYASGNYERGWLAERKKDGAVIVNRTTHAVFVEKGRRPGKLPPIDAIRRWVLAKRLTTNRRRARGIAFVIAKKIGRRGVKGRWVLARTMPEINDHLERGIKRVIAKYAARPPRS